MIGLGLYQRAVYRRRGLPAYLCHLCWEVAAAIRAAEPDAVIVLRGDVGQDDIQVNFANPSAEHEAERFFENCLAPVLNHYPHVFSIVLGINEAWPGVLNRRGLEWRARFEFRLCQLVQWRGYAYAWGSISVGNLEAKELALFAPVIREAAYTNYHGYLSPGVLRVEDERESYCLYRPTRLWLPELRRLGLPARFLYAECGPYYAELHGADLARCQIDISKALTAEHARVGLEEPVVLAYGSGMMGSQSAWELEGDEGLFAAASQGGEQGAAVVAAPTKQEDQEAMTLQQEYPQIYAAWVAAGGPENNFRKHLLGIGTLKPTPADLKMLADECKASAAQMSNALANYPF